MRDVTAFNAETAEAFKAWYQEADERSVEEVESVLEDMKSSFGHSAYEMITVLLDSIWDEQILKTMDKFQPLYEKVGHSTDVESQRCPHCCPSHVAAVCYRQEGTEDTSRQRRALLWCGLSGHAQVLCAHPKRCVCVCVCVCARARVVNIVITGAAVCGSVCVVVVRFYLGCLSRPSRWEGLASFSIMQKPFKPIRD